jgi:hypothetical protein
MGPFTVPIVTGPAAVLTRKEPCVEVVDAPGTAVKLYVIETIAGCPLGILVADAVALTAATDISHHIKNTASNNIKKVIILFMTVSS